jgi:beta-aspartyl-peptidase (threonine type)
MYQLIVHGGAGTIAGEDHQAAHRLGAELGLAAGEAVLRAGGSALDAVHAAVRPLEAALCFNAGPGSQLDEDGYPAMDAAIMAGRDLRAGAVAALCGSAQPINVARAVLEDGRHVLLAGAGAARFARERGLPLGDPLAHVTPAARARLAKRRAEGSRGTVGAVARDVSGHVAVATSTGGTVGRRVGRIGDSPVLGAGTLADDRSGAVSATGDGEAFLRTAFAARLLVRLERDRGTLHEVLMDELHEVWRRTGGRGGAIVVTADGRLAWGHTTADMTVAWATEASRGA